MEVLMKPMTRNLAVVYGRVSALSKNNGRGQDVKRQFINLEKFAAEQGDRIVKYFSDSITGKSLTVERAGFKKMLEYTKKNSIYTSELSRVSRRVSDLTVTIEKLIEEHRLKIIIQHPRMMVFKPDENGKLNIISKMMLMMLGLGSEMEICYQQVRRLEGIELAKKEGRYRGRIAGSNYSDNQMLERHKDIVNLLKHSILADTKIKEVTKKGLSTVKRVKRILDKVEKI